MLRDGAGPASVMERSTREPASTPHGCAAIPPGRRLPCLVGHRRARRTRRRRARWRSGGGDVGRSRPLPALEAPDGRVLAAAAAFRARARWVGRLTPVLPHRFGRSHVVCGADSPQGLRGVVRGRSAGIHALDIPGGASARRRAPVGHRSTCQRPYVRDSRASAPSRPQSGHDTGPSGARADVPSSDPSPMTSGDSLEHPVPTSSLTFPSTTPVALRHHRM